MRLYLSSYRLGDHTGRLLELLGGPCPVGVIANAMDALPDLREKTVRFEIDQLAGLGLAAEELDLRAYFADPSALTSALAAYRMLWVRGGNTFVLRHAMAASGADVAIKDLLARDAVVYAGYSAGCCVLAPSLHGIELVDPLDGVESAYGAQPRWDGLGVLPYAIVPHYRSDHPESAAAETVAERYQATGVPHRTLRDGQVIVVHGEREAVFSPHL